MLKLKEVGIDLGSDSIKIAVVDKTGRAKRSLNPSLSKLEQHEVYEVNCKPYSKEYYQLLKESLKSFSKKHKVERLSLNIAVPVDNINSFVHFMNIPIVDKKLLDSGISFEAEQKKFAEGITNSYSTWKIVKKDTGLSQYEIMLATIKKDLIDSLAQFKTIKSKVNRVILQPVLLERVCDGNDIVIDLGHKGTRVYLYIEGKLSQIELIDIGGEHLLEDIKEHLDENLITGIDPKDIIKSIPVYSKMLGEFAGDNDSAYTSTDETVTENKDWHYDDDDDLYGDLEIVNYQEEKSSEYEDIVIPDNEDENSEAEEKIVLPEYEVEEEISESEEDLVREEGSEDEDVIEESPEVIYDEDLLFALSLKIDDKINRIIDEAKRIIRMFELQNGVETDTVYYFGQLSSLEYFKETLESELELDLKPLDILDITDVEKDDLTLQSIASLVALDGKLKDDTNFSKFIKANVDYSSLIIMLLSISLSTGIALKVVGDNYAEKADELNSVEVEQMHTISALRDEIGDVELEVEETEGFISKVNQLRAEKKWLSDMLYLVPELTPLTVAIKDMNIVSQTITIDGYSSDYSSIGFFANKLKGIADVNIESIEEFKSEETGEIFSVTMDNPELLSNKYKIKQTFKITLKHTDTLLDHGDLLIDDDIYLDDEDIYLDDDDTYLDDEN